MNHTQNHPAATRRGFTLIELLVSIAIISLLTGILLPSLGRARKLAQAINCLSNLNGMGKATALYQSTNKGFFFPYKLYHHPTPGVHTYFWGTDSNPVDPTASPLMKYAGNNLGLLQCPSMPWGSYVPQGVVNEPTTTYGYNARYLDPALNGKTCKHLLEIPSPGTLFVLADTAMSWSPGGVNIFQNSAYLEPITGSWVSTPTNHFRHQGRTQVLCGDGHAQSFGPNGATVNPETNLGFVGTRNQPHYEQ